MNFLLFAEKGITLHNMGSSDMGGDIGEWLVREPYKIVGSGHGAKLLNQSDPNGSFFFTVPFMLPPTVLGKTVRIRSPTTKRIACTF